MRSDYPLCPLSDVLRKSTEQMVVKPDEQYQQITVRLWGKGVVQRDVVSGVTIAGQSRFVARARQLIVSRIDARNGAFGLVPDTLEGALVTNDFPLFSLDETRIVPHYLEWLSKTEDFVNLCRAASEGTTNRVRLKEDKFLAMPISLPPLDEQRRIVVRIEELATKIAEARGLQLGAQQDARKMLLALYNEIAPGSPELPLAEVAPLQRRPVRVEVEGQYRELGVRSFGRGTFHKPTLTGAEIGTKKLFNIEPDDLLFNIVFAWEGAVAVAKPGDVGRVGSHRFLTCVPKQGVATAPFLCFHFLTERGIEQMGEASPGGAGRNRTLGLEAAARMRVPVPAFEKQLWFDGIQSKIDAHKQLQGEVTTKLDALLPAVLDRAFRGEL